MKDGGFCRIGENVNWKIYKAKNKSSRDRNQVQCG